MTSPFDSNAPATGILTWWWQRLEDDKGARAELRRCESPQEVMFHPAFIRLCGRLEPLLEHQHGWMTRLAAVVGLLAHVRVASRKPLALQMAGNPPRISELRFRRLLQRDRADLYAAMIRVLRMLDHRASLSDLMDSVFFWDDPVRQRWALEYFPNTPEPKSS